MAFVHGADGEQVAVCKLGYLPPGRYIQNVYWVQSHTIKILADVPATTCM